MAFLILMIKNNINETNVNGYKDYVPRRSIARANLYGLFGATVLPTLPLLALEFVTYMGTGNHFHNIMIQPSNVEKIILCGVTLMYVIAGFGLGRAYADSENPNNIKNNLENIV